MQDIILFFFLLYNISFILLFYILLSRLNMLIINAIIVCLNTLEAYFQHCID
jgi:hypothetical protein